jgi:hypothetical protein
MVRTRLRKARQAKLSSGRTTKSKLNIPPELLAPIAEIEEPLSNLVTKFAEKKVLEVLGLPRYKM